MRPWAKPSWIAGDGGELPYEQLLRLTGAGVTLSDDPTAGETVATIPGTSGSAGGGSGGGTVAAKRSIINTWQLYGNKMNMAAPATAGPLGPYEASTAQSTVQACPSEAGITTAGLIAWGPKPAQGIISISIAVPLANQSVQGMAMMEWEQATVDPTTGNPIPTGEEIWLGTPQWTEYSIISPNGDGGDQGSLFTAAPDGAGIQCDLPAESLIPPGGGTQSGGLVTLVTLMQEVVWT